MFGVSVYFQDLDLDYIRDAHAQGATHIFTSLHIPEEDMTGIEKKIECVLELCRSLNITLIPDLSPRTFDKLNIEDGDYQAIKDLGFKMVRLDFGFDDFETVKRLTDDFVVMLNASTLSPEYILEAQAYGINLDKILVSHNFYPRKGTALSTSGFKEKNQMFKKLGLKVQAFVEGDRLKRFPLYEGLPTLEKHRGVHPYVAALELIRCYDVDTVTIGDSLAYHETLIMIGDYYRDGVIQIKAHLKPPYDSFYDQELEVRVDVGESAIRLAVERDGRVEPHSNGIVKRGSICMVNKLYGRYSGELQIALRDQDSDARINTIGFIHPDFTDVLELIKGKDKIIFRRL